jgi:hypothetical protein
MQDFAHDLAELHDLLERAELLRKWIGSPDTLGPRKVVDLILDLAIREDAHARPGGAQFDTAEIEFHMEIGGGCTMQEVNACSAQVVIDGIATDDKPLRFALHFDRHDPSEASTDLHAHYHWQVGGKRMAGLETTGVLHLEGPRFPSHPLDPVLLVDFVLSHFHGGKRADLLTRPEFTRYRNLVYGSQTRYVTPFFKEIGEVLAAEIFQGSVFWPSLTGDPSR